jgi:hypothetical protein
MATLLAGLLAGWAALCPVPGTVPADGKAGVFLSDAVPVACETGNDGFIRREAAGGALSLLAAQGWSEGRGPEDGALRRSILSLEERIGAGNRRQNELQRSLEALRRENQAAMRGLSRNQRLRIRTEVRAALRDIQAARRELEQIRKHTQTALNRFRHHRRQLDWEAVRGDLELIARYGEQAIEQLQRELDAERRLAGLLQRVREDGGS